MAKLRGRLRSAPATGPGVQRAGRLRSRPEPSTEPTESRAMLGLFVLRVDGTAVLARIDGALYLMAFSDAARGLSARRALSLDGADLFYVCAANRDQLLRDLRAAGARGYIVDYDSDRACFARAGAI